VLSSEIQGEAREIARIARRHRFPTSRVPALLKAPACIVTGGEDPPSRCAAMVWAG